MRLSRSELRSDVRDVLFGMGSGDSDLHRVGMEVELIPVRERTGEVVHPRAASGTGEALARVATKLGWRGRVSDARVSRFELPGGGAFSFEPGGQVEYSSAVYPSVDALCAAIDRSLSPVISTFGELGIKALTRGIDPLNSAESAVLVLDDERYRRMARHLADFGVTAALAGWRMMRQTAAIHLNLELGPHPLKRWVLANQLAPYLVGIFANSSIYEGSPVGFRSFRAQQWRELDPARTGLVVGDHPDDPEDPIEAYLDFALRAPILFLGDDDAARRPLSDWLDQGAVDLDIWRRHLSTLFPEVRARGYLEFRGIDALDPSDYAAPAVFAAGILYDERASREAGELLPSASRDALAQAGRSGVYDAAFCSVANELWRIAFDGARRLEHFIGLRARSVAERFFRRYTARGLDPASTAESDDAQRTAQAV